MNVWIFFSVVAVVLHVSAPYSRAGFTVVLKILILMLMVRLGEAQMFFIWRKDALALPILTLSRVRRRGRQRKRWEDNIKEWTGLQWNITLRKAENREEWRKLVVKSTVVPQRSARLRDR